MHDFIEQLHQKLQAPLPGTDAQYRMAHAVRQSYAPPPLTAKEAGVMALLYPKQQDWHLALIQRTSSGNPNDSHSGQISFPGGKRESSDIDLQMTALRETEEEIGVAAKDISILGRLTELYIPVSNFRVFPYVGYLDHEPEFALQPSEVHELLQVPFPRFQDPAARQLTDIKISQQLVLKKVPYYNIDNKVVWGATAMMISELLAVLE